MANFPKPLQELSDEEIFDGINNHWSPDFGILGSYELLRRLTLQNSESSKRFAWWSLGLSIVAIFIAIILGFLQMSAVQNVNVIDDPSIINVIDKK